MAHPDSPWKNHRDAKPESRWERWTSSVGAGNRHRSAAWDLRGMDAVAGHRRQNLAPRPGKEMGGERVTRSGNRPTADDRRAERRARRAEREIGNLGKKAKTAAETAADLRNQAAATTDRGAKRRLDAAAKRAERDVKRYTGKVEDIQEDLAESWKRR